MNVIRFVIPLSLMFLSVQMAFGQNFKIQIAAYVDAVAKDYFEEAGIEGVYSHTDQNGIFRYFVGGYETREDAEKELTALAAKGFPNAQVIDIEEQQALCGAPCPYVNKPGTVYEDELSGNLYIRAIFFDFDKSFLRPKSKSELEIVKQIMSENPAYSVQLMAHTDSKGTPEYNEALSKRRASSAQKYLERLGITADRIKSRTFGETDPIAKNEKNGKDSPEGRQYNRRVVMAIINSSGEIMADFSEPINVPEHLQIGSN